MRQTFQCQKKEMFVQKNRNRYRGNIFQKTAFERKDDFYKYDTNGYKN